MPTTFQPVRIEGDKELLAALQKLSRALSEKVQVKAIRKGAFPIKREMKARAPEKSELLKKSIIIRKASKRVSRDAAVGIGPSKDAPHGHLVEFGTEPRRHKSGKSTGQMPAHPFMRTAFDAKKDEAQERMGKAIWAEIEKAVKKLA
jgi:HK97 gp10 family phage protein